MAISKEIFPHKSVIEWWYFNGNLRDKHGKRYAFMNCLFRADPKKTNIPLVEKIPKKEVYFSHSIVSNLDSGKVIPRTHPISILSEDSLKSKKFFINYLNPSPFGYLNHELIETKDGFKIKDEDIELFLKVKKKPFLHNGNGIFNLKNEKVYYYSFTNLEAKGSITLNGKKIEVEGKAWMDHEWATFAGEKSWDWFSIQLDNDVEIMIQNYNHGEHTYFGMNQKNGKGKFAKDLILTPTKFWKSKFTGAEYPTSWKISIPSQKISLNIDAPLKNQEIMFGSLNYWEGPINVSGKIGKQKVKGEGFMELVGRKMKRSKISIQKARLKNSARKYLALAKKEAKNLF